MAVVLRLQRMGTKKKPFYRVVAADKRKATTGKIIERVGHYDPRNANRDVTLAEDRVLHWLNVGAQPSDTVRSLLAKKGILQKHLSRPKGQA